MAFTTVLWLDNNLSLKGKILSGTPRRPIPEPVLSTERLRPAHHTVTVQIERDAMP